MSASHLRSDIYRLLDEVLQTGVPIEIERKGKRLRISPAAVGTRLSRLVRRDGYIRARPEELIHMDWSREWKP